MTVHPIPEPIPAPHGARCMLTPVPVPGGVLLPLQDGTLVCREASGATRWRLMAFPPDAAPAASARLRRIGPSAVVLDDGDRWTCIGLDVGEILWGPVPFGASRLARQGDDRLWWNYVPNAPARIWPALNPRSGRGRAGRALRALGVCAPRGLGAVLVLEGTDLVRRDATTADVIWREGLPLESGGDPVGVDASRCLLADSRLILPVVGRGLLAFDDAGRRVWTLALGDAVFSVALTGTCCT